MTLFRKLNRKGREFGPGEATDIPGGLPAFQRKADTRLRDYQAQAVRDAERLHPEKHNALPRWQRWAIDATPGELAVWLTAVGAVVLAVIGVWNVTGFNF